MIKCPKCGFEQPKDRFCAKCGIVMENFSPNNGVNSKSYKSPLIFLVPLVILMFLGGVYWLYNRNSTAEPETAPISNRPSGGPAGTPLQPRKIQPLPQLQAPQTLTAGAVANDQGQLPPNAEATVAADSTSITISFDLLNHEMIERLTQGGEGAVEIGRYSMSVVPEFKTKYEGVTAEKGFNELGSESRDLALSQPSLVFRGGKEPKSNEAIGFFVEVTPLHSTDRGMEYKTSIKRTLPEIAPSGDMKVASQNYDETVTVPRGSAIVLGGLLPRKTLLEGEDELYKTNILKALLEPSFQKGDDEFIIVIAPN